MEKELNCIYELNSYLIGENGYRLSIRLFFDSKDKINEYLESIQAKRTDRQYEESYKSDNARIIYEDEKGNKFEVKATGSFRVYRHTLH